MTVRRNGYRKALSVSRRGKSVFYHINTLGKRAQLRVECIDPNVMQR